MDAQINASEVCLHKRSSFCFLILTYTEHISICHGTAILDLQPTSTRVRLSFEIFFMFLGHTNQKLCILVNAIAINLCKITELRKTN